ncbi:hypothetical protein AUR61_018645 [Stutzerimonas balearica]|nr:hypothetical protein AUR61_018645 [Stutzerimonas balearica]
MRCLARLPNQTAKADTLVPTEITTAADLDEAGALQQRTHGVALIVAVLTQQFFVTEHAVPR